LQPVGVMKAIPSLRKRGLRAGAWVVGSQVLSQVLRLASNLILTRFLLPEAFGLMAVISTVLLMLMLFSDIGSGTTIVQSQRGADEEFLNTAWTVQVMRGVGLWVVSVLLALGLAFAQAAQLVSPDTVYGDPRLPLMIAVASFVTVINGFSSLNAKLAERNLDFAAVSLIEVGVGIVAIVAMALGAWWTGSVWVLVAGSLLTAAAKCALTHLVLKGPRSRFRLESEALRELFSKGKWVVVSSVLGLVAMSGDKLLLGGLVDSTTLGLYSIALGLASIASTAMSSLLGRVVFPVFSEVVRHRHQELPHVYLKLQQAVDACVGLLAGFVFMAADVIVGVLYDARYQGVGHILGILAVGSVGIRFVVAEQVYLAMGQTSLLALAGLPRALIILVGVPLGYSMYKLDGALLAVVLSQFAHWPLAIWFRIQHKFSSLLNDVVLLPAIAAGLLAGRFVAQTVD
jgi:O-antigen/teichoic acid export membrane protein